ncbi:hypothetical protein JN853_28385 [Pseudomonas syringae pv. actinidiae ICMP 9853]|nr:hypothetical protein JN853_28385 [Pseudomonas syringae pv. actinidiae ICMP 9853]
MSARWGAPGVTKRLSGALGFQASARRAWELQEITTAAMGCEAALKPATSRVSDACCRFPTVRGQVRSQCARHGPKPAT